MKQRIWITKEELDRLKKLFEESLNESRSVCIPFETVLPLLEKPDENRILWCRQARTAFADWGLRVGVRTHQKAYNVEVVDRDQWTSSTLGQDCPHVSEEVLNVSELIPASDSQYQLPSWSDHLLQSLVENERVLLSGPTGCGKSSLIRELASRHHKPFMRVNLTGESSVSDIVGGWRVQGREMTFQYGPVPQAMKNGCWLCLDEIDACLPQVLFVLQALLEEGGKLFIPELNQWIQPHPEFRIVATANTIGKGDETGLYSGTVVLNEAFLDRWDSVFLVDYMPEAQETELLTSKVEGLDQRTATKMVRVASDLRSALRDGVIYSSCSTRKLLSWARKTIQLGCPKKAVLYSVLNKLSEDDKRVVQEVLQRYGFKD